MRGLMIILAVLAISLLPAVVFAGSDDTAAAPPISQPLLREGALAVRLADALGLSSTSDEAEAESLLAAAGVAPRNGWIADYPVTPDIVGELRVAVDEASVAGRLTTDRDSALKAFDDVIAEDGLAISTEASGQGQVSSSGATEQDPTVINNYYYDNGPPVVTYYAPPPDYAYLYTWVPYPFWWTGFWFPGYYVLVDFDVVVVRHHHRDRFSNHVFDRRDRKFFSINPAARAHDGRFIGNDRPRVINPGYKWTGGDRPWYSQGDRRAVTNMNRQAAVPSAGGSRIGRPSGGRFYGQPGSPTVGPSGGRTYRPAPVQVRRAQQPAVMPHVTAPAGGGRFYSPAPVRSYNPPGSVLRAPQRSFNEGGRPFFRSGTERPALSGGISAPAASGRVPFNSDGGRGAFFGSGRR